MKSICVLKGKMVVCVSYPKFYHLKPSLRSHSASAIFICSHARFVNMDFN